MERPLETSSPYLEKGIVSPLSADLFLDTIKSLERRAAGLLEMARFVREPGDFHEVLGKLLAKASDLVGADAGVIALADKPTAMFKFVNVHYASLPALEAEQKEKMLQLIRLKLSDGIIGQVFASGEPQILSDLSHQSVFRKDVADTVNYEIQNWSCSIKSREGLSPRPISTWPARSPARSPLSWNPTG
jgi:hypothetical protein